MTKKSVKEQLQQCTSVCNVACSQKGDFYNWPTARGDSGSARRTLKDGHHLYISTLDGTGCRRGPETGNVTIINVEVPCMALEKIRV